MLKKRLTEAETVRFGPFVLDRRGLFLTRGGRPVDVPRRSLALLARLTGEPGRVVTKADLIDSVWGPIHVSPTSLGEAMSRLRSALGDDPRQPAYIETAHGRGYRFVGAVRSADRRRFLRSANSGGAPRRWAAATVVALLAAAGISAAGAVLAAVATGRPEPLRLARLASDGRLAEMLSLPAMEISDLAVAPDGRSVALAVRSPVGSDIWIYDGLEESLRRLTDGAESLEMIWSPDGRWIIYAERRPAGFDLVRRRADGEGATEVLLSAPGDQYPESFSADGRTLIYSELAGDSGLDIAMLRDGDDGWTPRGLLSTPANEYLASLAPGGDALAFVSDRSGRWEAYVQRLDRGAEAVRVSFGGVRDVFWSPDGSSVHCLRRDGLVRVDLGANASTRSREGRRFDLPVRLARVDPAPEGGFLAAVF